MKVRKHLKRLLSYPISRRNKKNPFEFGPMEYRHRLELQRRLENKDMGELLDGKSTLGPILKLDGGSHLDIGLARTAFRSVQRYFESWSVEQKLKPWKFIGVMSNGLESSGLSGVARCTSSTFFIAVSVGTFYKPLAAAFDLFSNPDVRPELGDCEFDQCTAQGLFQMPVRLPKNRRRRAFATACAYFGLQAIFFHELSHLLRGHNQFLATLSEQERKAIGQATQVQVGAWAGEAWRRAIETDADDFAGRFMACALFRSFSQDTRVLSNPDFEREVFKAIVGTVLSFAWYERCEGYHSGLLRAFVILGSMLSELGVADSSSAYCLRDTIDSIRSHLAASGYLDKTTKTYEYAEAEQLIYDSFELRERLMRDWLKCRPWGYEGSSGPQG